MNHPTNHSSGHWHIISWVSFGVAVLLLLLSMVIAIGPGHRFRTPLVDRSGTIDRQAFAVSSDDELARPLNEIEMLLRDQERHWQAINTADGVLFLSWLFLAIAFALRVVASPSHRLQLTDDARKSTINSAGADKGVPPRAAGN